MTILRLTYAIMLPTILGSLFVAYISRRAAKQNILENLAFGYGIGMGFVTFGMFILGWLQISFSLVLISSLQISAILLLGFLMVKSDVRFAKVIGVKSRKREHNSQVYLSKTELLLVILLACWIVYKVFSVVHAGFSWPIYTWDSWKNISSGAKFFFYEKGLALEPSNEHFFGKGYRAWPSYPLNPQLIQTWFALSLGSAHEAYMKFCNTLYYVSAISLVFFALRRDTSLLIALFTTFFLANVPLFAYHATTAYADLPLSYYALASSVCFLRYMNNKKTANNTSDYGSLVLTGTFVALAVWTKLEGLLYCIAFTLVLFVSLFPKKNASISLWKNSLPFLIPIFIVAIPWFTFLLLNDIALGRGEEFSLRSLHFEVFPVIWKQIMLSSNFNIIFLFFFTVMVAGAKQILKSEQKYLYSVLFVVMTMFLFIYITTGNYKWVVTLTAVNRNILTFVPIMYYVSALTSYRVLNPETSRTHHETTF